MGQADGVVGRVVEVEGHAVGAVDHQGDALLVGAQPVDGLHVLLLPDADAPVLRPHHPDVHVVVLGAADQGLRVEARGSAEAAVILRHLLLPIPPAKAQVQGGEFLLADPADTGGKGVVDARQALPGSKAQHPHPMGQGEVHLPYRAGGGLPGSFDDGQGVSLFIHGESLVFLF